MESSKIPKDQFRSLSEVVQSKKTKIKVSHLLAYQLSTVQVSRHIILRNMGRTAVTIKSGGVRQLQTIHLLAGVASSKKTSSAEKRYLLITNSRGLPRSSCFDWHMFFAYLKTNNNYDAFGNPPIFWVLGERLCPARGATDEPRAALQITFIYSFWSQSDFERAGFTKSPFYFCQFERKVACRCCSIFFWSKKKKIFHSKRHLSWCQWNNNAKL